MTNIKLWEILVPVYDNQANKFSVEHHEDWDMFVISKAGGLTLTKTQKGKWQSTTVSTIAHDEVIPVRIACNIDQMFEIAKFTCRHYKQEAVMYYVVHNEVYIQYDKGD